MEEGGIIGFEEQCARTYQDFMHRFRIPLKSVCFPSQVVCVWLLLLKDTVFHVYSLKRIGAYWLCIENHCCHSCWVASTLVSRIGEKKNIVKNTGNGHLLNSVRMSEKALASVCRTAPNCTAILHWRMHFASYCAIADGLWCRIALHCTIWGWIWGRTSPHAPFNSFLKASTRGL